MRQVININKKWAFSKEADHIPETMPEKWYWVDLPHTWNAIDGQDGGNDYYRGTCYYAKMIERTEFPRAAHYYLEFCGANAAADVYVNGQKAAHHDGGYSIWRAEITELLQKGSNLIAVAVDNKPDPVRYPIRADFTFYGGLYRDVNIIAVDDSHFDLDYYGAPGIKVTPVTEGNTAKVTVNVYLTNPKAGQQLTYTIRDREGNIVQEKCTDASETEAVFEIPSVHLWNGKKDPYLYHAEAALTEKEKKLDEVKTRFGCRSFSVDPDKGFFLNGESYPLHGVARHQDRKGVGNALLKEHHEEDMDLICELGATTIRLAHYQHDPYFYDLCDERGLIVWAEIPYISRHLETAKENTMSQMKELIIQNYNHPSIVVWGLSNEITQLGNMDKELTEHHKMLNEMVHRLDPTRLTVLAAIHTCDIHHPYLQIPDLVSYNIYYGWYYGEISMYGFWLDNFHKEFPELPIGLSEYGCEALDWHSSQPKQGDYTEEYQAHWHEEAIKQVFTRPYLWATHVWNMFDFAADGRNEGGENGQNHKGLVTFDRKYKKDAFYAYKAWLSDEPFVHICGKRYTDRVEETTKVTVYSNQPEVELFVNGKSLGRQKKEDHFFYFDVPNTGESVLTAKAGECCDESHIRKVETFPEKYRLKEQRTIFDWYEIETPEGYFSLYDTLGEIMETEKGNALISDLIAKTSAKIGMDMSANNKMVRDSMGNATVMRMMSTIGNFGAPNPTREELLALNAQLNKISKKRTE